MVCLCAALGELERFPAHKARTIDSSAVSGTSTALLHMGYSSATRTLQSSSHDQHPSQLRRPRSRHGCRLEDWECWPRRVAFSFWIGTVNGRHHVSIREGARWCRCRLLYGEMEVVAVLLHQLLRGGEALGSTGGYIGCHSADRFEYHRIGIAILLAPRILIAKMAMMANFSAYIPNALTGKINL
jgi:hypothetical protein